MFSVKTNNGLMVALRYHKLWLPSPLIGMPISTAYTSSTIQFYFSSRGSYFSAVLTSNILELWKYKHTFFPNSMSLL